VTIAKITCREALANKLAVVLLSNNIIKLRIKNFRFDILEQTTAAARRSENLILDLGETADLGNDAQLMVFVRYRATEDYVEQFLFSRSLAKHTTGK